MFSKILIANDGSEGAARALAGAITLAKEHDAALHMISVEELPRFPASIDEVVEERATTKHVYEAATRQANAQAQAAGVKLTPHVVVGHPVSAISEFVVNGRFDLLVVGYMGHSEPLQSPDWEHNGPSCRTRPLHRSRRQIGGLQRSAWNRHAVKQGDFLANILMGLCSSGDASYATHLLTRQSFSLTLNHCDL